MEAPSSDGGEVARRFWLQRVRVVVNVVVHLFASSHLRVCVDCFPSLVLLSLPIMFSLWWTKGKKERCALLFHSTEPALLRCPALVSRLCAALTCKPVHCRHSCTQKFLSFAPLVSSLLNSHWCSTSSIYIFLDSVRLEKET